MAQLIKKKNQLLMSLTLVGVSLFMKPIMNSVPALLRAVRGRKLFYINTC